MGFSHSWFQYLLTGTTILIATFYIIAYIGIRNKYGNKFVPLLRTIRTLILACFMIYFYNPFRSKFSYGKSLPTMAFAAGTALLLSLERFDILNLVHFLLYGDVIPAEPKKVCRLENAPGHV